MKSFVVYTILILSFFEDISSSVNIRQIQTCPVVYLKNGKTRRRQRGRFMKFTCNSGYMLAGEKFSVCVSGKWEPSPPVCVRATCNNKVNPPTNGLIYPTHSGAALHIYCKPGYQIKGPSDIYCDGRKWDNNMPTCLPTNTKPKLFCDFESDDICGWSHDLNHDFDWRRLNFDTPSGSIGTGPKFDHTKGPGQDGYYMYIESSSRNENDSARLISPVFDKTDGDVCLEFFYHMYGSTTGSLRVYLKRLRDSWDLNPRKAVFSKSGNQGDKWYRSYHSLGVIDDDYQIVIEGIRGPGYVSDIAIDDVKIIENCFYEEITTTTEMFVSTEFLASVESCENRCGLKDNGNDTHLVTCDCDDNCYDSNRCCPDYFDFCVSGTFVGDTFSTYMSNDTITTTLQSFTTSTKKPPTTHLKLVTTASTTIPTTTTTTLRTTTSIRQNPKTTTPKNPSPTTLTAPTTTKKITIPTRPTVRLLTKPTLPVIFKKTKPPTAKTTTAKIVYVKPKKTEDKNSENDVMKMPKQTNVDEELIVTSMMPKVPVKENWSPRDIEKELNSPNTSKKDKYYRVKTENSSGHNVLLVVISVLGVTVLTTVISIILIKRYRCSHRHMASSNGDSQSDVRYLTSDEVLDFSLDKNYDSL